MMLMHPTPIRHTQLFCLIVSSSNKRMASIQVKIDTGASRNFLPLHLFKHLYPNCIDKAGHPTGLNVGNIKLTAYNGTQIPLFGSSTGPITWKPGSPSAQPHQINSCWYVADTPGPAILGLPLCKGLEVIKMNCAVKVIQDTSKHSAPPTPKKTAQVKYTVDPFKEYPDSFQGISQFPDEYTIRLCDNAQPVIHTPRNVQFPDIPKLRQNWTRW